MTDFHAAVILAAVPAIWILIAIVFANAPDSGNSGKAEEEDEFTVFSSLTDPSQNYLSYNIWHDDDD
jgi:hypothetical protein